jgi:hypothetical protein
VINRNDPPRGSMYLYDDITPPTVDGSYTMTVTTTIAHDGALETAPIERHFDIVGPRFTLDPTVVVNVYPPRNGQGSYEDALPQAVLKRRTLPWERLIDSPTNPLPLPQGGGTPVDGQVPWVALLLFEEGEYTMLQNQRLEDVVPPKTFADLGSPANILCDAIEADAQVIRDILPSREELQLLCHVRQVNVEDRELSAGSSDGFFSVVMSNRLPAPGTKCRACLVSLEQRTDLVRADPPPFSYPGLPVVVVVPVGGAAPVADAAGGAHAAILDTPPVVPVPIVANIGPRRPISTTSRLVLLHSWQFTVTGPGTFRTLMQRLDVGMIGARSDPARPALSDTGHLQLQIQDRGGETEVAWYRGPLVPWQLTRDPLGPYHTADQCRRATPETGAEDVSYAAAFEVGRQLTAADARLAQELMRWRREAYKQAARADTIVKVQAAIPVDLPAQLDEKLQVPLGPVVSVSAARTLVTNAPAVADRYGIDAAAKTIGMVPAVLAAAWNLSAADATALLGGDSATLGATVTSPAPTARPDVTLADVAADTISLDRLGARRDRVVANAKVIAAGVKGGSS